MRTEEIDTMERPNGAHKSASSRLRFWLVILVILGIVYALLRLVVIGKPDDYEDDSMHFKYGSIGSDNLRRGIPYEIWRVLPVMFHDYLPDGDSYSYEAFGLIIDTRDKQDRPIGFSKRWHLGVGDVIGLNCAFCHVSTLRQDSRDQPEIILGMPANTVDVEQFFRFLLDVADDPRLTVEDVLHAIERKREDMDEGRLGYWKTFIHRHLVIPTFINGLQNLQHTFSFLDRRPTPFGPGRVDTWAAYKVLALQDPFWFMEYFPEWGRPAIDMDAGAVTGLADFPALWKQKVDGGAFHWDGNTTQKEERNITAALGAGVTPATLDLESLRRIDRWMEHDLKPAVYGKRFPGGSVELGDPEQGRLIFRKLCYDCHAEEGERIQLIEPVDIDVSCRGAMRPSSFPRPAGVGVVKKGECEAMKLGTDPERLKAFPQQLSDKLNEVRHLSVWRFAHYRTTRGYANLLLTGIWLRAPFLHNGSVPTLWHLLQPPENRPQVFCRGNDLYDWEKVGFEWRPPHPNGKESSLCAPFHTYDTRMPGNGNGGHEYGIHLKVQEKQSLIEYLKTR